ncbi:hypothetical protein LINPERHAP1_LOCUS9504, partial [Linum perenne]
LLSSTFHQTKCLSLFLHRPTRSESPLLNKAKSTKKTRSEPPLPIKMKSALAPPSKRN